MMSEIRNFTFLRFERTNQITDPTLQSTDSKNNLPYNNNHIFLSRKEEEEKEEGKSPEPKRRKLSLSSVENTTDRNNYPG